MDEHTPLLHLSPESASEDTNAQRTGVSSVYRRIGPQLVGSLIVDSIPVTLSYILQNSTQTVSILVTGRLGPEELSAAAFSMMLAFVTGWCVALGGGSALDTLGNRPTDLSVHFQRCVILLWLLFIPVAILWAFIEPVLLAIGEPARLCKDVQAIMRILIFGAPGYIAFESLKKYLQCQGIMRASTIVLILVSPINLVLNIFFVHYTPLGMLGCPVALSITYWLCFILLILVTFLSPTHKANATWGRLQLQAVMNLKSCFGFLKLALPGILMVGTEWAAFEIVALAAGKLGELSLAAQSVIMTTDQIIATIPFSFGVVASTRVGNLLGARSAIGARNAAHASALTSVLVGSAIMTAMLAARNDFGYMFSDDEDVVRLVSQVMPLLASFQIADGLANACGGTLRGQGRQHLGAIFNIIAYYVLALPVGITLAFSTRMHLGLKGLWIGKSICFGSVRRLTHMILGQVIGLFTVGAAEYIVVWLGTNWDKEVEKSVVRNAEEAKRRTLLEQHE
ncbi:MATE efflux family protein [Pisolithus orientalis]|uniref:MATE efflux family protein n=1 Tax=Pisolithus orientalis TaxID=936130 RepID=UPI0022245DA5|nr:MATE efflux family protein [Pisolithus orientalis]KAI6001081.1 MATE efflux family protein [Pisolithus orientalis]